MEKIISSGFSILNTDGQILLGKIHNNHPVRKWTIFKGGQEKNESLVDTAIRELKEETDIDLSVNHDLNRYMSSSPIFEYHLKHKIVYVYLLEDVNNTLRNYEFKCNSFWEHNGIKNPEIIEYKWFEINDAMDFILPSQKGLINFLIKNVVKKD